MKLILDIEDSKVGFFMELLKNFRFVKVKPFDANKNLIIKELEESIDQINQIKNGQMTARPVEDLLNEV